mgnify:CR=1 FL=1
MLRLSKIACISVICLIMLSGARLGQEKMERDRNKSIRTIKNREKSEREQ